VVVDRMLGLIAFVFVAVVMALLVVYSAGQAALWQVAVVAAVVLLGLCAVFALMLSNRLRGQIRRLFGLALLSPLAPLYDRLSGALSAYRRSYGALALGFCISILVLTLGSLVNYLIALALGGGISLLHIFLFTPLITFVLLIPISLGGIGLNQSAYVFFFNLVGVPEEKSFAISLIMQAIIIVASLPGGMLWWRKRSARQ
ncbi:MAG TPA: lysylphosphatidylglycerol synthase domain-containing protein, partial [Anaerolineae bacterium]|nr:lysylphosphatidylglycerol synthase domain-containing protein [Anaerolineae bacterium]